MRSRFLISISLILLFLFVSAVFSLAEEEITITTYYPSPYGVYNELTTHSNTYLATQSGSVGIGIASNIESKLHVAGGIAFTRNDKTALFFSNIPAMMSSTNDGYLLTPTGADPSDLRLYIEDDYDDTFSIWGDSCGGGGCWNLAKSSKVFEIQGGGQAYFKGNVGIGTASPSSLLDIGAGYVTLNYGYFLRSRTIDGTPKNFLGVTYFDESDVTVLSSVGNGIKFTDNNFDAKMIMTNAGNLGIGTMAPGGKLEIVNDGEMIQIGGDTNNPSIELRDTDSSGLRPYIDFSNDATQDFDMRLILQGDDLLRIDGGSLKVTGELEAASVTMGWERKETSAYTQTLEASCSSDKRLLGGGCKTDGDRLVENYPIDNDTWHCQANQNTNLKAYAICAKIR